MMLILVPFLLFLLLVLLLHIYISWNYDYWKKRNIFYLQPHPFFGNFTRVTTFQMTMAEYIRELYDTVQQPFFGLFMFHAPNIFIRDEELIKRILVQDFDNFPNHVLHKSKHDDISGNLLICMKDQSWKTMRQKMSPFFSSGKVKNMMEIFSTVGENMIAYLEQNCKRPSIEARELFAKYTTDVIAKSAFAIDANSFLDENAEFRKVGRLFFEVKASAALRFFSYASLPAVVDLFKMSILKAYKFLKDIFELSLKLRENNPKIGNDLIDIILELRRDKDFCEEHKFEGDKIIAQAIMFFVAEFETVSGTIAFTLYELAINPDVQERARNSIKETIRKHDVLTHDCIQDMKYIDMIISESLRKYPTLPFIDRMCSSNYKIPGTDVTIEKGVRVIIPLVGIHYDEKYFPNPDKFDPERFSDRGNIPFGYMPFGRGPRSCLGERFAVLNAKIAIVHILTNFRITKSTDTPVPLHFEPKSIVLASKVGIPLKFNKLMQGHVHK